MMSWWKLGKDMLNTCEIRGENYRILRPSPVGRDSAKQYEQIADFMSWFINELVLKLISGDRDEHLKKEIE